MKTPTTKSLMIPLGFLALAGLSAIAVLRTYSAHSSASETTKIVSTYREYAQKAAIAAHYHKPVDLPPVRFANGVTITAKFDNAEHPNATCVTLDMRSLVRDHIFYKRIRKIDNVLDRYNIMTSYYNGPWRQITYNWYAADNKLSGYGPIPGYGHHCHALP